MDASFVTKLPAHEIGQAGVNSLRQFGVDTSKIVRGGDRVGIYFLEKGASLRPSKVIYDRAGSAIATATTADFNCDEIFEGADWFHFAAYCQFGTWVTMCGRGSRLEACSKEKQRNHSKL